MENERAIVIAAQQGDADAWEAIYQHYHRRIMGLLAGLCFRYYDMDLEDIAHTVWVYVYRYLPDYSYAVDGPELWHWISILTRNAFYRNARDQKRSVQAVFYLADWDRPYSIEDTAIRRVFARELIKKISNPSWAQVVELRVWEGLYWEEISDKMRRDVRVIRSYYEQAIMELREYVGVFASYEEEKPKRVSLTPEQQQEAARRFYNAESSATRLAGVYGVSLPTMCRYIRAHNPTNDPSPRNTGSGHHKAKFTDEQIQLIRARYDAGEHYKALAKEYGVAPSTIRFIGVRQSWKHVPERNI